MGVYVIAKTHAIVQSLFQLYTFIFAQTVLKQIGKRTRFCISQWIVNILLLLDFLMIQDCQWESGLK